MKTDWIERMLTRLARWELSRLMQQAMVLEAEVAGQPATAKMRMEEHDAEAKLLRDHFEARLKIDAIEAERRLAAKRHRIGVLRRELGMQEARA